MDITNPEYEKTQKVLLILRLFWTLVLSGKGIPKHETKRRCFKKE